MQVRCAAVGSALGILGALCCANEAQAQDHRPVEQHGLSAGFSVQRLQDDFGGGAQVSSPAFASESIRLTLGGGMAFFPHDLTSEGQERWTPYGHARLVVEAGHRLAGSPARLYGVGGPVLLFVPDRLSEKHLVLGGWGGFGFEIAQRKDNLDDAGTSYFVEFGGIGTGASASRLPTQPIFANGFLINVGFRAYP